jgi:soluble lytic murein transglycosylase-like protein
MTRLSLALTFVLLTLPAAPATADLYGFVDEHGRVQMSDVALDSRYILYTKAKAKSEDAPLSQPSTDAAPVTINAAFSDPTPLQSRRHYADMITRVAREQKLDPALLHAVVTVESAYNAQAVSPKGATGLMQLMPDTGKRYGVTNLMDPLQNLRAGARYLRDLLAMFNNNLRLVLAAYNAGEGAVIRAGHAIPPFRETRAYVPRVLQHYERYREL